MNPELNGQIGLIMGYLILMVMKVGLNVQLLLYTI